MTKEELKEMRTARGWSRERLARALSISAATVMRWERHGCIPGPADIALRSVLTAECRKEAE